MAQLSWYSRDELKSAAQAKLRDVPVVLDVGPGIRPSQLIKGQLWILVEPHGPYIEFVRRHIPDGPTHVFLQGTWDAVLPLLPDRSVDTIIAGDVIEHLPKGEGLVFLMEAERIARCQVAVFTPLGYYPQAYDHGTTLDRWGMNGGYWQAHRSGWLPDEFDDGWECLCCDAYHDNDEYEQPLEKPFGAFYAIRTLT